MVLPVQLVMRPVIYLQPKNYSNSSLLTNQQVASYFHTVIYERSRMETYLPSYKSAGYSGSAMVYLITTEAVGPLSRKFASPNMWNVPCNLDERNFEPWTNNVTMDIGAFCQIQDSIANGTPFDHDLHRSSPSIVATEDWFLHIKNSNGTKGERAWRNSGGGVAYYPNPGNSNWREYFTARVLREVIENDDYPYNITGANGIYLDNVELGLNSFKKQVTNNQPAQNVPFEYSTDSLYAQSVLDLVSSVSRQIKIPSKDGSPTPKLWANLISGNNNTSQWNSYRDILDGGFKEDFALLWGTGSYSSNIIKNQLIQASIWIAEGNEFVAVAPGKAGLTQADRIAEREYAFRLYLLIAEQGKTYFSYKEEDSIGGYAAFDTQIADQEATYKRLGTPLSSYIDRGNNLFTRNFRCGTVSVYLGNIAATVNTPITATNCLQ